jgi:hypothetical protein
LNSTSFYPKTKPVESFTNPLQTCEVAKMLKVTYQGGMVRSEEDFMASENK